MAYSLLLRQTQPLLGKHDRTQRLLSPLLSAQQFGLSLVDDHIVNHVSAGQYTHPVDSVVSQLDVGVDHRPRLDNVSISCFAFSMVTANVLARARLDMTVTSR